ncbi:glycosyltransferase [Streptomyces sp. CRN 30]|uniref:glycosyltransferase n=1 Tax=Streptomyces sp. CRN 30 TaxID=3075613 RepID=UPI002A7F3D65|nr:glycosyltransferase [Streptomyces sp. CRN 30]
MTRTISVVTPVHAGGDAYLHEAYASLRGERSRLPDGWDLRWVVQEDGRSGRPLKGLPDDPWISPGSARRGGPGVARTMALPRATGDLVRTLDADDAVLPGGLARDIRTMTAHPGIGWCVSAGLDLLPDGTTAPGPYDPPEGPLAFATLLAAYDDDLFPVIGTHLTVRRTLLLALGGWPAVPAWEPIATVLNCAAVAPGRMIAEPSGYYRKHPGQTTAQADYSEVAEAGELRAVIKAQALALHALGWRWTPQP